MKKTITLLLLIISFYACGQALLYNSPEDYYNHKPIENAEWYPDNVFLFNKIEVLRNGIKEKVKPWEIGVSWASNSNGMLMRLYKEEWYDVVIDGAFCYYIKHGHGEVIKSKEGGYSFRFGDTNISKNPGTPAMMGESGFQDFYSLTLNGEIEKFKEHSFTSYLDKYGLKDDYKHAPVYHKRRDYTGNLFAEKANVLLFIGYANEKAAKEHK